MLRDEIIELEYHPEDENGKRQMKITRTASYYERSATRMNRTGITSS